MATLLLTFALSVVMHWGAYVTGGLPWVLDETAKRLSDRYTKWSEKNRPLRRRVEVLALLGGLLFASFEAWQEERVAHLNAENSATTSHADALVQKQRADDANAAINGRGGYKDQISALSSQLLAAQNKPPRTVVERVPGAPASAPPSILKRLIAYDRQEINADWSPTSWLLRGYNVTLSNVGDNTITTNVKFLSVYIDNIKVYAVRDGKPIIVPQTQGAQFFGSFNGGGVAIPPETKQFTLEYEVDYDTIPATGVRHSYKKLVYPVTYPNGPKSNPSFPSHVVDEWER